MARRLARSHVGLLAALRTAIGSVFDGSGLPQYQLEPLDWEMADRLVRARFPILGADMRRRLLAEAAGNPLALLELPVALSGRRPFASPGSAAVLPLSARLSELFASACRRSCQPRHGGCCCLPCWTTRATWRRCSAQPQTPSWRGTWRPPSEAGWSTSIRKLAGLSFGTRCPALRLSSYRRHRSAGRRIAPWPACGRTSPAAGVASGRGEHRA